MRPGPYADVGESTRPAREVPCDIHITMCYLTGRAW